ncbi:CIS tube protein [Sorangium sp. So ce381]|uniref:CIS tube protein n=1 Tax=Sorangium sp. So ce381 TaxID=3133307 RepID=UPI003F5B9E4D
MSERQVLRGFLANVDVLPPLIVTFQFNPASISDNKAVSYADRAQTIGCNAPGKVYTGGGHRTISFDLKLHGLEEGTNKLNPTPLDNGVSTELAKLRSFLYPKADAWATLSGLFGGGGEGTRISAPPTCYFGFGTRILECVLTDLRVSETQFNSMLAPVRADVGVTLVVIEETESALYEFDKQHRNVLAALGLQNIRLF